MDDGARAMKGILFGVLFSLPLWGLAFLAVWYFYS